MNQRITVVDLICRAATAQDDAALRALVSVPMTTRGVLLSFQREPSYFDASKVIYKHNHQAVVVDSACNKIVALYSNGYRPCYIDSVQQNLRYSCDLRVDQSYRGKALVLALAKDMKQTMFEPNFSHIIIFNDNHAARAAIQSSKLGMPDYYDQGLIETLTLTGFKRPTDVQRVIANFNATVEPLSLDALEVRQAKASDVPAMNKFIQQMAEHYNYLLAYDFNELLAGDPYFHHLSIDDFQLYLLNGEIVGMFGLWRQSQFKQSKVLDYGWAIQLLRPLYNVWAAVSGGMPLPKRGEAFKYHALHSLLCHPQQLALHDLMLHDALRLSKQQGVGCISYTLSHQDPRQQLNACYKGERLVGMHGFLSYEGNPLLSIDSKRIPFLEVGRI